MGGPPDQDLRAAQIAATASIDWERVVPKLERFALSRGASVTSAADEALTALTQLFAGETSWDPAKYPDVATYLMGVVRRNMSNARKSARGRNETAGGLMEDERDTPAEEAAATRERRARAEDALAKLRAALADDADALAVIELTTHDVGKPADQAARLGLPVQRVYDARDRIGRHVRRIAKEQEK